MKKPVIIIQAGGRGSRLRHHTWNKPKALVSYAGRPILFHIFDSFPNSEFIVIGDYHFDVIESYLKVVPPGVDYTLIKAEGKGTMSGIAESLKLIEDDAPIILLWSDVLFSKPPKLKFPKNPVVYLTNDFVCRWVYSFDKNKLLENPGNDNGVMGFFYFPNKLKLENIPNEGEFVKWISNQDINFDVKTIKGASELGDFQTLEDANLREGFCRFFNDVKIEKDEVIKKVIDPDYKVVHERELAWYDEVTTLGYKNVPKIKSKNPLVMERIFGSHAYEFETLSNSEQKKLLDNYLDTLNTLHGLKSGPPSVEDLREVYIDKTISRVFEVSHLIPNFTKDSMTINGLKAKNIFSEQNRSMFNDIFDLIEVQDFSSIHGDCTFSNSIVDKNLNVKLIDPRGYFAKPGILGDPNYDFSKLYYSAVGGYDLFNRRAFKLHFDDETAEIIMPKPLMQDLALSIFQESFSKRQLLSIKIIHALIWLSLSGYAKDDYDSAIGSFYLGLYWLEDALK
ncbi:MAG: hypothetical protein CBE41_04155 [Gammaproteobacteria bacterium TMED281]|nr:MAG: hypothetical protein CBE41_04155 [Gammaproteobacteria bacterium TMED281]